MPIRSWIVLTLGIVIALGTVTSLTNRPNDKKPQHQSTQAIIATADIPAGAFIRSDIHLAMVDWPRGNITESMLTTANSKISDFNGAVARRSIEKGEPIQKNLLVRSNEGGFMSAVLDAGKRAVSIAVDPTSGNAGFIFPGDRVDLILTHSVEKRSGNLRASETFVEDVRVLAVDQMLDNPDNKAVLAKTVTLEVTPKQVEVINLAKDLGKISLSLRSLASNASAGQAGDQAAAPAAPVAEAATPAEVPAETANQAPGQNEPESLDDILREEAPQSPEAAPAPEQPPAAAEQHPPNVTRDTDVSQIIAPESVTGSRVTVIRGSERTDIEFHSYSGESRNEP